MPSQRTRKPTAKAAAPTITKRTKNLAKIKSRPSKTSKPQSRTTATTRPPTSSSPIQLSSDNFLELEELPVQKNSKVIHFWASFTLHFDHEELLSFTEPGIISGGSIPSRFQPFNYKAKCKELVEQKQREKGTEAHLLRNKVTVFQLDKKAKPILIDWEGFRGCEFIIEPLIKRIAAEAKKN